MSLYIIKDKKKWNLALEKFRKLKNYDVYHDINYFNLYSTTGAEPNLFLFEKNGETFALPFLKKKIKGYDFYDFETAYGYGGPLSTTLNKDFINDTWKNFKEKFKEEKIIAGIIRFNPILNSKEIINDEIVKIIYQCKTIVLECNKSIEVVRKNYSKDIIDRLKKNRLQDIEVNF